MDEVSKVCLPSTLGRGARCAAFRVRVVCASVVNVLHSRIATCMSCVYSRWIMNLQLRLRVVTRFTHTTLVTSPSHYACGPY